MPDCMMPFPEDWHDFLKDYSFDDSEEVYTNGSRLIPVFRVEQLIKHLLKAQEPVVLALDEIHRGMAVWLEDVDKADVILAIGGSSALGAKCFITEKDMSIAPKDAEYGIRWRAWTQEPTDAQREAIPWN